MNKRIAIAAHNGDIGGGEVMLFHISEALRSLGFAVSVIAPSTPSEVLEQASDEGFHPIPLAASSRLRYIAALTLWRLRNPHIPLWCNGLVPAVATTGMGQRIVHLHSTPRGAQSFAARVARMSAARTLVPSSYTAEKLPGAQVFENWTNAIGDEVINGPLSIPTRIGYLGRVTVAKGVVDLARAVQHIRAEGVDLTLVVGGELRHAASGDDIAIRDACAALGEAVEWRGWVDPETFFRDIDLLVVPSRLPETFGLVVAEAMAYGVPTLVSDAGALAEVAGEKNPWVFRAGEVDDLTRALRECITEWPSKAHELSLAGRRRWKALYSPEAGRQRLLGLLSSMSQQSFGFPK